MILPHSSLQRELWRARLDRFGHRIVEGTGAEIAARRDSDSDRGRPLALRVHAGHALIGLGSWLSGERVERAHRAHHHPA